MGNTWGQALRVTTFGESHGKGIGAIIDGLPAGIPLSLDEVQRQLQRRRPGQSALTTSREEDDLITCLSGIEDGVSIGSPITLVATNRDMRPADYAMPGLRPSHSDYTTLAKYGRRAKSGGGRTSARETLARVAAGSLAEQYLRHVIPAFEVVAWVEQVHTIRMSDTAQKWSRTDIDQNSVRCPDAATAALMMQKIADIRSAGDSVGGVIRCLARAVPAGLGEPVFDKLEAELAKAMMSLPASKGFEIGSGFAGAQMLGSEHNDPFVNIDGQIRTTTNHSGGIQGGISNGEDITMRIAFKPVSTIFKSQQTVNDEGVELSMKLDKGRHDPCVLPRAVPMVEAMACLVLADLWLRQQRHRSS